MDNKDEKIKHILSIQRHAWNNGHENYGSELDVKAGMYNLLTYFKHLNKAQNKLLQELSLEHNLCHAKKLCSKAHKAIRHYIVTLK